MKKFPKFDYCIIYISEAHPFDGWKIDNPEQPKVNQPKPRNPLTHGTPECQPRDDALGEYNITMLVLTCQKMSSTSLFSLLTSLNCHQHACSHFVRLDTCDWNP